MPSPMAARAVEQPPRVETRGLGMEAASLAAGRVTPPLGSLGCARVQTPGSGMPGPSAEAPDEHPSGGASLPAATLHRRRCILRTTVVTVLAAAALGAILTAAALGAIAWTRYVPPGEDANGAPSTALADARQQNRSRATPAPRMQSLMALRARVHGHSARQSASSTADVPDRTAPEKKHDAEAGRTDPPATKGVGARRAETANLRVAPLRQATADGADPPSRDPKTTVEPAAGTRRSAFDEPLLPPSD